MTKARLYEGNGPSVPELSERRDGGLANRGVGIPKAVHECGIRRQRFQPGQGFHGRQTCHGIVGAQGKQQRRDGDGRARLSNGLRRRRRHGGIGVRQQHDQIGNRRRRKLLTEIAQRPGAIEANTRIGVAEPGDKSVDGLDGTDLPERERGRSAYVGGRILQEKDESRDGFVGCAFRARVTA